MSKVASKIKSLYVGVSTVAALIVFIYSVYFAMPSG